MPRTLQLFSSSRTRTTCRKYQKLDDRIYLLSSNHTGQAGKPQIVNIWNKMTPESSTRTRSHFFRNGSSPKHFLTWSATAANHKIQKLSKHLAQNVSKLQVKVDKVLHPAPDNDRRHDSSSSKNVQELAAQHDHLLSVNNVHVAVVHNLSVSRGSRNKNEHVTSDEWKTFYRSRQKLQDGRKGYGQELDIFELSPLTAGTGDRVADRLCQSEDHDESLSSGISYGASTVVALSPHWSRASSLTASSSSGGDTILVSEDHEKTKVPNDDVQVSIRDKSELSVRILEEEPELRLANWFHAGIPREIALEVLRDEALGSFIVRESSSRSGCFALSLRVPPEFHPSGIAHYLIIRRTQGYKIKGFTKEFGTLTSLITHHSVMPELLPCPLYRPSPPPSRVSRANSSDFVEPEKLIIPQSNSHWKYTEF